MPLIHAPASATVVSATLANPRTWNPVRISPLLVFAMVVLAPLLARQAVAQAQLGAPSQPVMGPAGTTQPEANPLPGLPRPPDQPASLLQPAPAGPAYGCPQWECPYFARDPRLDPADLPYPGWLFDVETGIMGSHVTSHVGDTTAPIAGVVSVPMATLDWTVSPRFEAGYRLPSGFGELDVAYRFLATEGSGSTPAGSTASPDSAAALKSGLDINVGDFDYANHETSLGSNWDMKWRIGLRTADVFFDSRADEPFAAAAAGSGFFERSIRDNFWGIGPHAALELKRQLNPWGLGLVARLDSALLFGDVHQKFVQSPTAPGPSTVTEFANPQQSPMFSSFLGLDWRPPNRPNLDFLFGYTAEYWWNVGRLSDPDIYNGQSAGEVGDHGAQLRLEYNY